MTASSVSYDTWSEYQTKYTIPSFILIKTERFWKEATSSTMRRAICSACYR